MAIGFIGPIPLFGFVAIPLFVAFAAKRSPDIQFPPTWALWQKARQIYGAAEYLGSRMGTFGTQLTAKTTLEKLLRRWQQPPLIIKPWVVPPALWQCLPQLKRIMINCCNGVSNPYGRRWLMSYFRIVPGKLKGWADKINAKRVLATTSLAQLKNFKQGQLGHMAILPSLEAHLGPERLPIWPQDKPVIHVLRRCWDLWGQQQRNGARCGGAVLGKMAMFGKFWIFRPC